MLPPEHHRQSWRFQANKVKLKFSYIRSNSKLASALVRPSLLSISCCAHAIPGTCVQTASHQTRDMERPSPSSSSCSSCSSSSLQADAHVWCGVAAGAWCWHPALCTEASRDTSPRPAGVWAGTAQPSDTGVAPWSPNVPVLWDAHQAQHGWQPFTDTFSASVLVFFLLSAK